VAVRMILASYGPYGWMEKISILMKRANWLAAQLDQLGIRYIREQDANIFSLDATQVPHQLADKLGMVPDNHHAPKWYKVVIMDHVNIESLMPLTEGLAQLSRV